MLAIFRSEMRELWRSVGVRIFLLLLVGATTLAFVLGSQLHGVYSAEYPIVGFLGPRFFMSQFGIYLLVLALGGALLIAFDTRTSSAHLADITDAVAFRPASNLMLLGGRTFALAATTWLSMVAAVTVAQSVGAATRGFDEAVFIEPFSIACFLIVDALPATVLWCALVVLLHVVLRRGLLAVLAGLTLLALFWSALSLPAWVQFAVVPVVALGRHVSEITPWFVDAWTLLQRGSTLSCAAGALMLAARLHRREDCNPLTPLPGALLVLAGCLGLGCVALHEAERNDRRERWLAVHELASGEDVGFDLERLAGRVSIEPGVALGIDIVLHLNAHRELQTLFFSFNPTMRIADLRVSGESAAFRHEEGLLTIDLPTPVAAADTPTLALVANGVPDADFAYLDSAVDPRRVAGNNRIRLLGTEALLFDRAYVALMPAALWLPAAGANYGREDARQPRDFFDVDLAVNVPAKWHVAGGFNEADEEGREGRRTFRFRPAAPVAEVGLLAAAFDRRGLQAGDVEIELLFHPKHLRNVDLFAGVGDVVAAHATEILAHVESQGIGYLYATLSIVEVPTHLRSYGGGRRLGPALRMPGIVGVREVTFPTAHFDALAVRIDHAIGDPDFAATAKAGHLVTYGRQAGLLRGLAYSFLNTVMGASGHDAAALELLCLDLVDRLLPRPNAPRIESAHVFDDEGTPGLLLATLPSFSSGALSALNALQARYDASADRPAVWDRLATGEAEADADQDLLPLGVEALRVGKTAQAIADLHGHGQSAALLGAVRNRHAGGNFTVADLSAMADSLRLPVAPLLDRWLHGDTLPGFVASSADVARLKDDGSGPRYQARLQVRNEGEAPGLVALSTDRYGFEKTPPVIVGAHTSVELDWVGSEPPDALWLQPYLSANRHPFAIAIGQMAEPVDGVPSASGADAPFGARASDWMPATERGLIVDDLDSGFAVEDDSETRWRFRLADLSVAPTLDQGLPLYDGSQTALRRGIWHREVVPSAWGEYRRTIALAAAGDGSARAVASAHLPRDGQWELAFHVPLAVPPDFPGERAPDPHLSSLGSYAMRLRTATGETPIEFDGRAAQLGWNDLGAFELSAGEIQFVVSNRTSGQVVLFDAIRWRQ